MDDTGYIGHMHFDDGYNSPYGNRYFGLAKTQELQEARIEYDPSNIMSSCFLQRLIPVPSDYDNVNCGGFYLQSQDGQDIGNVAESDSDTLALNGVGVAVLGVVLFGLLAVGAYFMYQRYYRRQQQNHMMEVFEKGQDKGMVEMGASGAYGDDEANYIIGGINPSDSNDDQIIVAIEG